MKPTHQSRPAVIGFVGAVLVVLGVASSAEGPSSSLESLLRHGRPSPADFHALDAGKAVVKALDTAVRQELAYLGAVHVKGSSARFVDRFRDIERFEAGPGTPQIGRFSVPPTLEDLSSLTLPADDVAALSSCRPGACGLKLSAADIARFRERVNWSSPDAAAQANRVIRSMLLDIVRGYQAAGNAALGSYDDDRQPMAVAEQFRAMLASGHQLPLPIPELTKYLADYPRNPPAGSEDFFYWSVVDFGLKQTIRLNHVVIDPLTARPSGVAFVIAIKQLYASHYFQTTLELRFLVDAPRTSEASGFHLLSLTRSRIDGTSGLKGSFLRPIIARRSRTAVRDYMDHLKRQAEAADPRQPRDGAGACAATAGEQVCLGVR